MQRLVSSCTIICVVHGADARVGLTTSSKRRSSSRDPVADAEPLPPSRVRLHLFQEEAPGPQNRAVTLRSRLTGSGLFPYKAAAATPLPLLSLASISRLDSEAELLLLLVGGG